MSDLLIDTSTTTQCTNQRCSSHSLTVTLNNASDYRANGLKADIALPGGIPPQSYTTLLAIRDHTVLPATRHKRMRPA